MCARARSCARPSRGMLLVLLLCVCVLTAHFITEDLLAAGGIPTPDLHEHGEDHFVFPHLTRAPAGLSAIHPADPVPSGAFGFSLSPQPPPPNH